MMKLFFILCILSTTLNLRSRACNPLDSFNVARELKEDCDLAIIDIANFFVHLKVDYIASLTELKLVETFSVVRKVYDIAERYSEPIKKAMNDKRNIEHCEEHFTPNLTMASWDVLKVFKKCTENQFDILKPVEDNIQDFIKDRISCSMNVDPLMMLFCRSESDANKATCVEIHNYTDPVTLMPFTCDLATYSNRRDSLKAEAKRLVSIGRFNTYTCLQEPKREFENITDTIERFVTQCAADTI